MTKRRAAAGLRFLELLQFSEMDLQLVDAPGRFGAGRNRVAAEARGPRPLPPGVAMSSPIAARTLRVVAPELLAHPVRPARAFPESGPR